MNAKCRLIDYKIIKVDFNIENLPKGETSIEISTNISIQIPDNEKEKGLPAAIITELNVKSRESDLFKYNVKIQSRYDIGEIDGIEQEKIVEILRHIAVPETHSLLSAFVDKFADSAQVPFIKLPPLDIERIERV